MKTVSTRREDAQHDWYVVDADGKTLGRLASEIARRLRGKHKAAYTPHVDTGDYIVVVNAEKVRVTGAKETDKIYYRHSGYPGGIKATPLEQNACRTPRPDSRGRGQGDDAPQSARPGHATQAENLRWPVTSAHGAATAVLGTLMAGSLNPSSNLNAMPARPSA